MNTKRQYRKTWQYQIKMWLYRLTFRDITYTTKQIILFIIEIVMTLLGLGILLILPAFFR